MIFKTLISIFIFCSTVLVQAQTLSGDYQGYLYKNYYIGKYEKGSYVLMDSLQLDQKGTFTKQLNPAIYTPNTLYVVASEGEYKQNNNIANPHPHGSIRFVYMGGDVSYQTSWRQETGYLSFIKGGEASNHIKALNTKLQSTQKVLTSMEQLWGLLNENDAFCTALMRNYREKTMAYNSYCQSIASQYSKGSYMNLYASMYQQVVPKENMTYEAFQTYRAKNLFQFTDLKNPLVANVPLLSAMYQSYLYHNQPSGMAKSTDIEKMQDDAKTYIKEQAAPEVLAALNMKDFRPQIQILREKLVHELDFEAIYQNDEAWFAEINEVLGAYNPSSPYHALFGTDMIAALERTQKPEAYTKLAEAAFSITEQFNWGDAQTEILDYLTETSDARLLKGSGKVAQIYAAKKVQLGKQAPDLVLTEHLGKVADHNHKTTILPSNQLAQKGFEKTLLVFYESGCGPCEMLMQQLPGNYEKLKEQKIEVISISSDTSEEVFRRSSDTHPWARKYCDFKGKSGVNFKNYAVLGTPTIYLIDK
ncbi:peroxiredoxin family protein, partial [Nonlabens sp.]|uniref:peroxiredoxin family protein n=1 Tax=Nonlabens sp. TaxID=1888209 RepID=UPI003F696D96